MNRCVNINHPEFKELLNQSSLDPISLAADISIWQDKNDTDLFPTLKQLSNGEVLYQKESDEGIVASEKTVRELAALMSDRIGMPYKVIADRNQQFKGKIENGTAVINLAYATLDTPIHEILGHPIIRAIKNKNDKKAYYEIESQTDKYVIVKNQKEGSKVFNTLQEANDFITRENTTTLYQSLLKELEYGKGKEVLDRIKRDYISDYFSAIYGGTKIEYKLQEGKWFRYDDGVEKGEVNDTEVKARLFNEGKKLYTLEEQQEEAIVELLGMMTAERLDAVKDGKLISLLKRLLKEIKSFLKNLLRQREVEIEQLPDNMTIGDLADLLAYSNSKLILPGNEVIYTTPDNQTFKTYQEASNHISELANNVQDVDLNSVGIDIPKIDKLTEIPKTINEFSTQGVWDKIERKGDIWVASYTPPLGDVETVELTEGEALAIYLTIIDIDRIIAKDFTINDFLKKNKEYEQSKEVIEEWMKVNNIRYNPEEVYSRGQEFVSVVGAYSSFDVNLMMQNLLHHIEDNQKAGGEFAVSAITKPVDRKLGHLEGGGGKIRFKIYPQPHDILWAANADVYSGSVWDAGEKINKDKKSELLGVTYSKYPALNNLSSVKPNLAEIIDDLDHHHNELGIALTGSNFRLDYDDDIPYTTKKIINGINKILDQKYGKLRKPEITPKVIKPRRPKTISELEPGDEFIYDEADGKYYKTNLKTREEFIITRDEYYGTTSSIVQPKITSKDLKESITQVKNNITYFARELKNGRYEYYDNNWRTKGESMSLGNLPNLDEISRRKNNSELYSDVQYTQQALINTKVAKLKEVTKKYPRALIRSEVKKIDNANYSRSDLFDDEELPFQKIPSKPALKDTKLKSLLERTGFSLVTLSEYEDTVGKKFDVNALVDMSARLVAMSDGASTDALTEEIAHMAVAQSRGTKEYNFAMGLIEQTEEFEQNYDEYMSIYGDDLHTREEILGKILKKDLEAKLGTSIGMWLRRLWNKFLSMFRNKELSDYVAHITDQFVANPNVQGDGVFFQMAQEEKTLQQQVNKLNRRYKELSRRQRSDPSLLPQIKALEEELEGNKNGVGIYKFLLLLNEDTRTSIDFLKDYFTITQKEDRNFLGARTDKETPSTTKIRQLAQYIGYYLPFLKELNMVLDEDSVIGSERKVLLDEMIRIHTENFEVINRAYKQFSREAGGEDYRQDQLRIAGKEVSPLSSLREAPRDSNFWETWFGLARNNSDDLVRLVHRLVFDVKNKIRRTVLNWSDDFLAQSIDYIGKDMSWVAERVTVDQVNEKTGVVTKKVQKSGNFISEVMQGQWDLAREKFHTDLHDKYGFSQDFAERLKEKKVIQSYNPKTKDKFQLQEIQRLKDYNQEIAKWYTKNTIPNPRMDEIIVERRTALSPEQFAFWQSRNMETNKDGSVKYYKGELVVPSRGSVKELQYGDTVERVQTVDWTNKEYFKLSEKDRTFLDFLKAKKKEMDKAIPFADSNRLPQMYESTLDILSLNEPQVFKRLGRSIKSAFIREEDDTQFNDTIKLGDDSILDDIPIRFTDLLAEPDRVTTDILSSLIAYKQMQENYVQMAKELPKYENYLQISKRRVVKSGDKVIEGKDSWSFDALEKFLQANVSGKERENLEIDVLGVKFNVSKTIEKLSNWVRSKNLGFNFIAMTSNLLSSKAFATLESLVGNYTTVKSSAFANKEFLSILPSVISSFNGVRSTDRISSLMTYFGLGRDIREMFDDLDKHVLMRNQPDKTLMYGFEKGDYFTNSVVMISILDNYRVHENKWYTYREAEKAGLNFDEMTTAYNMLKVDKDGKVNTTIPESVINNLTARIKTIATRVNGSLSPEDKGAIYQNAVFGMVGIHRGWLFEGLSRRLKSKGYDFTLNQITEGDFRTVMNLIGRFFMSPRKLRSIKEYLAKYNELEDYQKENLKRVMLELSMIGAFTVIALVLNSGDDDDEDYFRDLVAYQANRVLLEVSSFYNPTEFVSAIKDPIVPARDLELVTNFTDMFNTKEIESGKWEGMTKQQKYFLQLVPGIKGWSTLRDPQSQNEFLKNKNLKPVYSAYEFFAGEEEK